MDGTSKHLAARYDAAAESWHGKIASLGCPAAYADLVQHLGRSDASALDVLDAGAGSAGFSNAFIAEHGAPNSLMLRDISSGMLSVAKRSLQDAGVVAHCIVGDIESLPRAPRYDLILCAHVIEHCHKPVAALKALQGALQPGGVVLLLVSKPHWCTALAEQSFSARKSASLIGGGGVWKC